MKVYQDREYNEKYPEEYNWALLESWSLSDLAGEIANSILRELKTAKPADRFLTPGLRMALDKIAKIAEVPCP